MRGGSRAMSHGAFLQRRFFAGLDGVRAVAVLTVITWHVSSRWLPSLDGYRGVQWFFALSGFLITTLALREEETGSVSLRSFFRRRAFRILPLYLLALIAFFVADVVVFRSSSATQGWRDYWPYYLTFMQDLPELLDWPNAPFQVAWSLAVEEKFYIVWPLVGFGLLNKRTRVPTTVAAAAALAGGVVLAPSSIAATLASPYLPILFGCLVAMAAHDPRSFPLIARLRSPVAIAVMLTAVVLPWPGTPVSFGASAVLYSALVAATMGAIAVADRTPILGHPWLLWIGRRSYAIYLFHILMIRVASVFLKRLQIEGEAKAMATLLLATVGSIVLADILHRSFELPFIRLGRRLGSQRLDALSERRNAG